MRVRFGDLKRVLRQLVEATQSNLPSHEEIEKYRHDLNRALDPVRDFFNENPQFVSSYRFLRHFKKSGVQYFGRIGDEDIEDVIDYAVTYVIDLVTNSSVLNTPELRAEQVEKYKSMFIALNDKLAKEAENVMGQQSNVDPEGKTWGNYLFGADRDDVPFEKNVPDEQLAFNDIRDMLYNNSPISNETLNNLSQLAAAGEYTQFLIPDQKYTRFYRGMKNIAREELSKLIGREPNDTKGSVNISRVWVPKDSGSSWSVSKNAAERYAFRSEIEDFDYDNPNYSIVLHAERDENPNTFFLNPDNLYSVADFKGDDGINFSTSKEVYALGNVKIFRIDYYVEEP